MMCVCLAAFATGQDNGPHEKPKPSRFSYATPLPTLPGVTLDTVGDSFGVAQQMSRNKDLQGRVIWIDGTANIDKVNSDEKVAHLCRKVATVGFNTIVFDIKPIVGYTLYPSKLTPQITSWRNQAMPKGYDPLKAMVREAKKNGLSLLVSMNAFSEGHRMAKQAVDQNSTQFGTMPGPGYDRPDQQTVLYEPTLEVRVPFSTARFPINEQVNVAPTASRQMAVITRLDKFKMPAGAVGVVLDDKSTVVVMQEAKDWDIKAVPMGGSVLVGVGDAATYLRKHAHVGYGIYFESVPRFVKISQEPDQQIPLMMNPHHPEVQQRVLDFIQEVLSTYAVDGVMFDDRLRYGGMNADFSDLTRAEFEKLVGEKLRWPDDVFTFTYGPDLTRGVKPGRWYDAWMVWRAETMRNWVHRAREVVDKTRPGSLFGIYAGSWFGEYAKYGTHYGSSQFSAGFSFLTDGYRKAGFADQLDLMISGCYYKRATIAEAMNKYAPTGQTVEAAGQLTNRAMRDMTWSYAGISLQDFWNNKDGLKKVLQAAVGSTQGVMVFDYSHKFDDYADVFTAAFGQRKKPPHASPGLLKQVRERRAQLDKSGYPEPPVIIREGAEGTGF